MTADDRNARKLSLLFAAPALLFLLAFVAWPMIAAISLSLSSYNLKDPQAASFVGLRNFSDALADARFQRAMINTAVFTAFHLPLTIAISLLLALMIGSAGRFGRLAQALLFVPVLVPEAMSAVIFVWIFDGRIGLLNIAATAVTGEPSQIAFLSTGGWAMTAIIVTSLWGIGVKVILFTAGLSSIPQSLYEAAAVDGAGPVRQFLTITLPGLRHTTALVFLLTLLGSLKVFSLPYIMTRGGPADSTLVAYHYIFTNAFQHFRLGYAAAMGLILSAVIVLFGSIQIVLAARRRRDE